MFLLLLCFFCVIKVVYALAPEENVVHSALIQATVKKADELQLAQHETWLALLHYKRETVLRRFINQADDE